MNAAEEAKLVAEIDALNGQLERLSASIAADTEAGLS